MATGDRNKKGKPTDIVRHFAFVDGQIPVCDNLRYGYSTNVYSEVTCKNCLKRIQRENLWNMTK